jgi:hypothetical protein
VGGPDFQVFDALVAEHVELADQAPAGGALLAVAGAVAALGARSLMGRLCGGLWSGCGEWPGLLFTRW